MKKRILIGVLGLLTAIPFWAQQPLTLDSCRQMALRNNKQLRMAEAKINAAHYNRKAAFTAYLPGIDVTGGYITIPEKYRCSTIISKIPCLKWDRL